MNVELPKEPISSPVLFLILIVDIVLTGEGPNKIILYDEDTNLAMKSNGNDLLSGVQLSPRYNFKNTVPTAVWTLTWRKVRLDTLFHSRSVSKKAS